MSPEWEMHVPSRGWKQVLYVKKKTVEAVSIEPVMDNTILPAILLAQKFMGKILIPIYIYFSVLVSHRKMCIAFTGC